MAKRRTATAGPKRARPQRPEVIISVVRPTVPPFDRVLEPALFSIAASLTEAASATAEAYKQLALANIASNQALEQLTRLLKVRSGEHSDVIVEALLNGEVHTTRID